MKTVYFDILTSRYIIKCKEFIPSEDISSVIIGVHGFGGDKESSMLSRLARGIGEHRTLICFDFPAHGDSPADGGALSVENCLFDLKEVFCHARQKYPNATVNVFATSFGGYITLIAIQRGYIQPESIILRAPALNMNEIFKEKLIADSFELFLGQGYLSCGFERKFDVSFEFYKELCANDARNVDPMILMLIFCAENDELVDASLLHAYAEKTDGAEISDVLGASHRFRHPWESEQVIRETVFFLDSCKI